MQHDRDAEEAAGSGFPCREERAPPCKEKTRSFIEEK